MPDVVTLGKGLGGGFPIAAFLCTEDVAKTVSLGDHGGTYAGNPLACAAANAVLRVIAEDGLVARAAELGARVLATSRGASRPRTRTAAAKRARSRPAARHGAARRRRRGDALAPRASNAACW